MLDLLYRRRSIRKYLDKNIDERSIDVLKKAVLLYPSSRGIKPLEFYFVNDKETLDALSKSKQGAAFLKNAALGIVICADPVKSDVWTEDASIASTIALLAAESEGLGACWIQIRSRMHDGKKTSEEYVKEILRIKNDLAVESIISLGYPDESFPPYKEADLDFKKINTEYFNR
jgi:nitroreductase